MDVTGFNINITSEQSDAMVAWYRDVLGLPPAPEMGEGAFKAAGGHIFIDAHSETHGPAKEPTRVLINLFVDDLEGEHDRLVAAGVKFIREPEREEWGGLITTMLDPDGNYVQLISFTPA